jgi:hypothetical protein
MYEYMVKLYGKKIGILLVRVYVNKIYFILYLYSCYSNVV